MIWSGWTSWCKFMNESYHDAVTMFPDGTMYAGVHELSKPLGGKLLATVKRSPKQLSGAQVIPNGKVIPNSTLAALSASVAANPEQSFNAAVSIANSTNLTHLQLIRLLPEAQGVPDKYFFLEEAFTVRDVPNLEYRETFYDTTATARYLRRLEESKATVTKYDEIKYDLPKLVDSVYTPIEDIFRTIINPQTVDLSQLKWGFEWKRNQSALVALKKIKNVQGAVGKFELLAATDFHSTNRAEKEFFDKLNIDQDTLRQIKNNSESMKKKHIENIDMTAKLFNDYVKMNISAFKSFDDYVHVMMESYAKTLSQFNKSVKY